MSRRRSGDVTIEKPFASSLKQFPFVTELAGAVLVEPEPGQWLLLGVGKTLLKDHSAEELLRAERVCTLKARAAAIGERDGAAITYLKRVEDKLTVVRVVRDEGGKERVVTVSDPNRWIAPAR